MLKIRKASAVHLNFLQLALILGMCAGLPMILLAKIILPLYDLRTALCSIIVGNLILWVVGTAIISMAYENRKNAIQNAKAYLGRYGGAVVALVLALALMSWFVLLTAGAISTVEEFCDRRHLDLPEGNAVRLGAALGFCAALFSIGRIRLIKWLAYIGFPAICSYHLYALFVAEYRIVSWHLNFAEILVTILMYLPGVMNLPTVFRHSRSKADSFLGFALMMVLIMIFQIASIIFPFSNFLSININSFFEFSVIFFIILYPVLLQNVLNIYLASACWETFLPKFGDIKGNVIFGLIGASVYVFIQIAYPIKLINDISISYLSSLAVVLVVAFLIQAIIQHRPRTCGKLINALIWIVSCVISTLWEVQHPLAEISSSIVGMAVVALLFLITIFFEEIFWSIKTLRLQQRHSKE